MVKLFRQLLVELSEAKSLVDVNIAAGAVLEQLLVQSPGPCEGQDQVGSTKPS